uniref:C-type lectin domain-containing protein n=1 Tax=Neogobius melanostomus TaxID=47308 RepID=A0A8C6U8E3_9GOBI
QDEPERATSSSDYHFVNINKTWDNAQEYCRKHYTDLATVSDRADAQRICGVNAKCPGNKEPWIGLQHNKTINETWRWTQPGLEYDSSQKKWDTNHNQPDHFPANRDKCVFARNKTWHDCPCSKTWPFICYNTTFCLILRVKYKHFLNDRYFNC